MNSLYIVIGSIAVFAIAYRRYGALLERIFGIDASRKTPAHTKFDGVDYVPAKHWTVLFGHHFASIAGAGPIIGPVLATFVWGWAPALFWIIFGAIFIGGVHDFGTLFISVRGGGSSIADISEEVISRRAKVLFSIFVWLTLILIVAVFIHLTAKTLAFEARTVIPSIGLIPVAVVVGFQLYVRRRGQTITTILGLLVLLGLVVLGDFFPINLGEDAVLIWSIILAIYCYFASITPVNILLQPRDYLSSFLLAAGVLFGLAGLAFSRPPLNMPFYIAERSKEGPIWPMLFVTVACGAVSGFHSLVSSGTTAKQISDESDVRRVGYGGMILEGVVAIIAVLAVAAGLSGRAHFTSFMAAGGSGPIGAFGAGYGVITRHILGNFGSAFAIVMLNAFVLTTLDTSTRIGRYLTEELFGIKNRHIATSAIIAASLLLALSGRWKEVWPIFGAANQLVAALALFVVTCWLLSHERTVKYTLPAAIFMLVTTMGALVYSIFSYSKARNFFLVGVSAALCALGLFICTETYRCLSSKNSAARR